MEHLLTKDLVVVTGKGGVGKTTVAAALGLAAAERGLRTVVVEVAGRSDVAHALGAGDAPALVERELPGGVFHVTVDPEPAMQEYLADQLPVRALADVLGASRAFAYLAAATPGLRELLTVGKVWELAQNARRTPGAGRYDLVVLDAPATGHGLALLSAPKTFSGAARVGPIARQGRIIHETLTDPAFTGVVVVATPEELPVTEAVGLRAGLRDQLGIDLCGAVLNAMLPDRFTGPEAALLDPAGSRAVAARLAPAGSRALRVALDQHHRACEERGQAGRLRRGLKAGGTVPPIVALPLGRGLDGLGHAELLDLGRRLVK
jgi:anion-transporting  ArsA/GET3 family ATPase